MRFTTIFILAVAGGIAVAQHTTALKTQNDKISYSLGLDLGNQLHKMSVELDPALFAKGLKDAFSGQKALLTEEQVRSAIAELQAELKQKQAALRKGPDENGVETQLLAAHNKTAGEAFLAQKKKSEGIVALPSGLEYRIIKAGNGKKPGFNDTVTCHYRGTLLDGSEIYNTYTRQEPRTLKVKEVIKGFTEALQLMPVGSKWELFVPPDLAYGETGGGPVGPNATLIYEVELLSID